MSYTDVHFAVNDGFKALGLVIWVAGVCLWLTLLLYAGIFWLVWRSAKWFWCWWRDSEPFYTPRHPQDGRA